MEGGTSQKFSQDILDRQKSGQSFANERFPEFTSGRKLQYSEVCPNGEMNIGFVRTGNYEQLYVRDIEIRRIDRMQFVTGQFKQSTFADAYDVSSCFVARVSTQGNYEAGKYLYKDNSHRSDCYNLALIPRLNYLVAVGYAGTTALPVKALIYLMDQNLNDIFMKVWTTTNDAYYTGTSIQSQATDVEVSEADGSIYVTGFVQNSFTRDIQTTPTNCFIMKLDTELNIIYAKSFGIYGQNLQCWSLQITRNVEFIYFGGYRFNAANRDLFFSKSNGNGDFMVTTIYPFSSTQQVSLRRILLDKSTTFTTSSDKLYFCGRIQSPVTYSPSASPRVQFPASETGDFIYGYLTSGDVETYNNDTAAPLQSNLIAVQKVYKYGSSAIELNSDCAMSDDNKYLMVAFSTNYDTRRPFDMYDIWTADDSSRTVKQSTMDTPNTQLYGLKSYNYDANKNPYSLSYDGCGSCTHTNLYPNDYANTQAILSYTPLAAGSSNNLVQIQKDCEDPVIESITRYTTFYDKQVNSWHQCKNYWWAFSAVQDCQINYLQLFPHCTGGACTYCPIQTDYDYLNFGGPGCGCSRTSNCDVYTTNSNQWRPWYTSGCYSKEQRSNIYKNLLTPAANDYIRQYLFCYDSDPGTGSCAEDDEYFLIFEQDCVKDSDYYYSMYVARFSLDDINLPGHLTSNPQIAAYLGDDQGDVYATAIALDQYGFVYVHGYSNAKGFGANTQAMPNLFSYVWVHLKTHWDLATEYEFNYKHEVDYTPVASQTGAYVYFKQASETLGANTASAWTSWYGEQKTSSGNERSPGFQSKKFIIPKKYQNVATGTAAEDVTFLSQISNIGAVENKNAKAYMMNEELVKLTIQYPTFSFSSLAQSAFIWGESYAKTLFRDDVHIYKDSASAATTMVFNLPNICVGSKYSASLNLEGYREKFTGKQAVLLSTTTATSAFSLVNAGQSSINPSLELGIQVALNSALVTEGISYFDVLIGTDDRVSWDALKRKKCLYSYYGYFWNSAQFNSRPYTNLARFQSSYRVRIIVDDESLAANKAPYNNENIEDIFPKIGLKSELKIKTGSTKNYFMGNCDRYFVKQQRRTVTYGGVTFETEALPHWIRFYERNQTFQFYPIIYNPERMISIEISCCNAIEQCATQTFHVYVQNTPPVSDFAQINTYVLQYDDQASIGQEFSWEMRDTYFYDQDKASDASDLTTYNLQDFDYRRTDHTVDMDFTDAITTFSLQFRHIKRLGIIFGQGASTIVGGTKLLNYNFRDNFETTALQYGSLKVFINKMPTLTTVGKSYTFSLMDPLLYGKTDYFDSYFPFLNNDDLLSFKVDTSLWFTDDAIDILTYGLSRSDNTPRPDWMDYDSVNGQMSGYPNMSEPSELYQLKFTVSDQQQGNNKLYKEMLLNTKPQARNLYKVIEVGVGHKFNYNIEEMFTDLNGDRLTFSLPVSGDSQKLANYGISFNDATKNIYGKPTIEGLVSLFTIRGTDPHGFYVDAYITIKIKDYRPNRNNYRRYYDREVYEHQRFVLKLEDDMFYDQKDRGTLVYQAYDPAELPLPNWITFLPHERILTGVAPKKGTQQVVEIRAMNTQSHDSLSVDFKITVIANPAPKTRFHHIPNDIIIHQNQWLDHQVPILMFGDSNKNYMPKIEIIPKNGYEIPSFLRFNPVNRTLYGECNETGSFHVDFQFTDDQGKTTYSNLRITVLPEINSFPIKNLFHYGFAGSAFLGLLIYFGYLFHLNNLVQRFYKIMQNTEQDADNARKRFGEYKEIDIKFKKPQPMAKSNADQLRFERIREQIKYTGGEAGALTARTHDYNFSVDHVNQQNFMENTQRTQFERTNENLLSDKSPYRQIFSQIVNEQTQPGKKTKIFSM